MVKINLYTDGACSKGNGGWAYSNLTGGIKGSGNERESTNNRMEIRAVIEALKDPLIPGWVDLVIVTDSAYVSNCFFDKWYENWRRMGWVIKGKGNQPVKNRELWEELLELIETRAGSVEWIHVRGHGKRATDDPMHVIGNDIVDKMAVNARLELVGAST